MMAHSSAETRVSLPDRIGWRAVLLLAWPMMISRMSDTVMLAVDTFFVSRLGTQALAGVGVAISASMLVVAFGWGTLMGVRVAVSHRTGAGDPLGSSRMAWQGVWLAALFGLGAWLSLVPAEWGLRLTGAAPDALPYAMAFFKVRVLGAPAFFGIMVLSGYFQGRGDTRTPMVGTLLANGLNLVLNPLLIFGWGPLHGLGAAGAALASVTANCVNLTWLALRYRRLAPAVSRRPDRTLLREITRLGIPMGFNTLQDIGSFTFFMAFLARSGDVHVAAHVVVIRVVLMSFLPGWAVGEAGGVLVGQSLGARRPELARQAWRSATTLAVAMMGIFAILFVTEPGPLLGIFKPEAAVLALGRRMLWIAAFFQVFDAIATVSLCCLNGAGDNRFVMALQIVASWLLKVPTAWVFSLVLGLGAPGAWMGMTLDIIVLAIASLWRIRGDAWLGAAPPPEPRLSEALA